MYAMIFNSPAFCGCDNLDELYDNESELWEGIEEYSEQYGVDDHKLWSLITKSYCSLLAKSYSYKDVGEFEVNNVDITDKTAILAKLLTDHELTSEEHSEQIGLTIGESFVESHVPTEIDVEIYNFEEQSPEKISLTDNSDLFPNIPATEEKSMCDFDVNDIGLLFSPTGRGSAHIEEITEQVLEGSEYVDAIYDEGGEVEVDDLCNYIKDKSEKIDFSHILKESNNNFYEWILNCHGKSKSDEYSVKISMLKKIVIQKDDKTYYFTSDSLVFNDAEKKSIDEIIEIIKS